MQASTTTYHKYERLGLCVRCGGERSVDSKRCQKCRDSQKRDALRYRSTTAGKEKHAAHSRKRSAIRRAWFKEVKSTLMCERCGFSHPAALEFHHRNPAEKSFCVAVAINTGVSLARVKAEMAKCEILCANCHAIHHWG